MKPIKRRCSIRPTISSSLDAARAYQTLLGRGITEVDTAANQAAWDAVAQKAREQLAERGVYSKSLLRTVEEAAQK